MLRYCEKCDRVFAHPTRRLCDACFQEEQEAFTLVKDYLQKNPKASVVEVSQETKVDVETIYKFVKEDRLSIIPSGIQFFCEICGAEIESGRICSKCRAEFTRKPQKPRQDAPKDLPRESTKIRYLDQIRKKR